MRITIKCRFEVFVLDFIVVREGRNLFFIAVVWMWIRESVPVCVWTAEHHAAMANGENVAGDIGWLVDDAIRIANELMKAFNVGRRLKEAFCGNVPSKVRMRQERLNRCVDLLAPAMRILT